VVANDPTRTAGAEVERRIAAGEIVSAADVKNQRPGAHRMGNAPGPAAQQAGADRPAK
jgi:hypothetical protein